MKDKDDKEKEWALQCITRWFKAQQNKDEKIYPLVGRTMSSRDLFEEIRQETELGKRYIKSIIKLKKEGVLK